MITCVRVCKYFVFRARAVKSVLLEVAASSDHGTGDGHDQPQQLAGAISFVEEKERKSWPGHV